MPEIKSDKAFIPFSPPRIDESSIAEVIDTLRSGWITTGPKTKTFEKKIENFIGGGKVLCLNSATACMEMILRWYGIGPGDEVIIPAYTYCATANVVDHAGATIRMVDVNRHDFNISVKSIRNAITSRTKAIVPVDIAGMPCDYDEIFAIVNDPEIKSLFNPKNDKEEAFGRIMVLADSAHSFGATYKGRSTGMLADASAFSFHAVKNLTTAEGGALVLNLPDGFDTELIYKELNTDSLHGQSKDALAKQQLGAWRYDVKRAGHKCNMTDIAASLGLVEIERYKENLERRAEIFEKYNSTLSAQDWAEVPHLTDSHKKSSYHLYMLRIKGITESQRDEIINEIAKENIAVNVHFIPIPELSYYKEQGFKMNDFPNSYDCYTSEISLPVYFNLKNSQVDRIIDATINAVEKVILA